MGGKFWAANCKGIYDNLTKIKVYRLLRFISFYRFIET